MFNSIGTYLARKVHHHPADDLTEVVPVGSPLLSEGIFVEDYNHPETLVVCPSCGGVSCYGEKCDGCGAPIPSTVEQWESSCFSHVGLEKFIGRFFGCGRGIVHSGNVCCYGTIRHRQFFYCPNPKPNFFSMHGEDASIIFGSNEATQPTGWRGRAVLLSELFSVDEANHKIVAQPGPLNHLFPEKAKQPRFTRIRMNKRRNEWLQYLLNYISGIQQTDQSKRKRKYKRPGFKQIRDWFVANIAGASTSPRTYRRDIEGMTSFDDEHDAYDKRDHLVNFIWSHIEDPDFLFAPKATEVILRELAKINADGTIDSEAFCTGRTPAWEGDSTRTLRSAPTLDIDKDLRTL